MSGPAERVRTAFGAVGAPARLAGGSRAAYRCGDLVLKRDDRGEAVLAWQADVLGRVDPRVVRVAPPVRSTSGALSVDGWSAEPWLAGAATTSRWDLVIDAGRHLADEVADEPRPGWLDARTDPWAVADRMACGERPLGAHGDVPLVAELAARAGPVGPGRLVHLDLTGNVLLHPTLPPAVIDLSPYWRPVAYSDAVVVADALCWHAAPADLARTVPAAELARALLFRLLTDLVAEPVAGVHPSYARAAGLRSDTA